MQKNHKLFAEVQTLAAEAAALRAKGLVRYPASIRRKVVNCLTRMRGEAWSWAQCAEAMGICKATLHAWHQNNSLLEIEGQAQHAMMPVKIREVASPIQRPAALTLHLPQDVTVTGVTLEQVAELARILR